MFIGNSALHRIRSSRVSAMVGIGLAIAIVGVIPACGHSSSDPSAASGPTTVGRWQAEMYTPAGQRQPCAMEIGASGQIAYGDTCPMPLTGQQATITSVPNGTLA